MNAEESRKRLRQVIKPQGMGEIEKMAFDICDQSGCLAACQWVEELLQSYLLAEWWATAEGYKEMSDNLRDTRMETQMRLTAKESKEYIPQSILTPLQTFLGKYPCLSINADHFQNIDSPATKLSDNELATLNKKLEGFKVAEWVLVNLNSVGQPRRVLMPHKVVGFELALSHEIVRDWIVSRQGHGFPLKEIAEAWNVIKANPDMAHEKNSDPGKLEYHLKNRRFITNSAKDTVITFFEQNR